MIRRAWAGLLTLLAVFALAACDGDGDADGGANEARPLTTEEAEHLAVMRFRNFDAGTRPLTFEVTDGGVSYVVDASVDFTGGIGYGLVTDAATSETLLLGWSATSIATRPWTGAEPPLPAPPVDESWTSSTLSPQQSRLHTMLAIVLTLGADRPDNALLLRQTDARWLRDDVLGTDADPVPVTVIAGPTADVVYDPESGLPSDGSAATLRYWIDDTGILHRLEVRLGGGAEWTVIDLGAGTESGIAADLGDLTDLLGTP